MKVLVTNTRNVQAYAIIRALRPHAQKIVATVYGGNRFVALLSHAARSRLVDKRYYVPSPIADWREGNIGPENTEREEAYVRAVERICEAEGIDTIFPSWDPQVYVFSKNKARFAKMGVLIPTPDYETVVTPLDKYRTLRAAEAVGFPCPRTYLPERIEDLKRIARDERFPLVIKPRFSSAGRGIEVVRDFPELVERVSAVRERHGVPMVQQYIAGWESQNFYLVLDRNGEAKSTFSDRKIRHFFRHTATFPTAAETWHPHPQLSQATRLLQHLGWWGGATVQTKVDAHDGVAKLMEVNPRLGLRLWTRTELGINEPLMCIKIALGEKVQEVNKYPAGTILLDFVEDMLGLGFRLADLLVYRLRIDVCGKTPVDPSNPPLTLRDLVRSYGYTYLGGRKRVFDPYTRYALRDPLVSLLWWLQFVTFVRAGFGQIGR